MPLFAVELDRLANNIGASDLTIWLHTDQPTDVDPTLGRISAGGGLFETGATLAALDISHASDGDISNAFDINFGNAIADVGTVAWWSAIRIADPVAYGTLPTTLIANGEPFRINAGTMQFNGATL